MEQTFTFGRAIDVELHVYDNCKYTSEELEEKIVKLNGVVGFDIVSGFEAGMIEAETDGSCIDEYHEYLVLQFADGSEGTFRNSHVDLFKI